MDNELDTGIISVLNENKYEYKTRLEFTYGPLFWDLKPMGIWMQHFSKVKGATCIDYYPTKYRRITEKQPIGVTPYFLWFVLLVPNFLRGITWTFLAPRDTLLLKASYFKGSSLQTEQMQTGLMLSRWFSVKSRRRKRMLRTHL